MTLDEARLMAGVNARAERLFEDGYRASWKDAPVLEVRNGRGGAYRVDTDASACDCPFFAAHQGNHPCKHVLGWKRLLFRQRACRLWLTLMLLHLWTDLDDTDQGTCQESSM